MSRRAGVLAGAALAAAVAVTAVSALAADEPAPPKTTYELVDGMSAKSLFLLRCSGCHRTDGLGAPEAGVPPFPGSVGKIARDGEGRAYLMHVPGVAGSGLKDAQLAAVMNYVLEEWAAEEAEPFTAEEVGRLRAAHIVDVVAYRRALAARLAKNGVVIADYPWP
ncbi:MAG: c-type cytochrome [Phenylobacterium sp.]|uniref:c-type cytochrome n=1 Tax=Phenylobacterium sp. TaxID=1871053 RepID=UPI00391A9140